MSYYDDNHYHDDAGDALEEMFQEWLPDAISDMSTEAANKYLRTFGDAIQERVTQCLKDAEHFYSTAYHESAIMRAFTAIELIVGHLLFRPLLWGVLISEEFADRLVKEVFEGASQREQKLLPAVLLHYGIDLNTVKLENGEQLWPTIIGRIRKKRNNVVHKGASASEDDSKLTLEAARLLLEGIVKPLVGHLWLVYETTNKWTEFRILPKYSSETAYESRSPFKD